MNAFSIAALSATSAEINCEHLLAMNHADLAVDHAKRVGELLLQVKASLPHGEFLPWLSGNVTVSARQAQRYIRAALGKPIHVHAIAREAANTTPASLLDRPAPDWLPHSPSVATVSFGDARYLMVQESVDNPSFYYVAYLGEGIEFTIKPVIAAFVEDVIFDFLPGAITGACKICDLQWELAEDADPYSVRKIIDPHLPDGYEHLKYKPVVAA